MRWMLLGCDSFALYRCWLPVTGLLVHSLMQVVDFTNTEFNVYFWFLIWRTNCLMCLNAIFSLYLIAFIVEIYNEYKNERFYYVAKDCAVIVCVIYQLSIIFFCCCQYNQQIHCYKIIVETSNMKYIPT